MQYKLRPYQKEASRRAVEFLKDKSKDYNAMLVLPTGSGKSLIVADIAYRLKAKVLVLQPSIEILTQNYNKMCSYGVECSMYSASAGVKEISKITFATIGSIFRKPEDFKKFKYVLTDECHLVCEDGMHEKLYKAINCKVLGLTATPFRLYSQLYIVNEETGKKRPNYRRVDRKLLKDNESYLSESQLKFLTNIDKGSFKEVLYAVQVKDLLEQKFLAKVNYYYCPPPQWDNVRMYKNSSGSDFSDKSQQYANEKCDMLGWTESIIRRVMNPKTGVPRKGILVFVKFVDDAYNLAQRFEDAAVVDGKMSKKARNEILEDFKRGKIKVIINVGVLVVGFDYPECDTVIFARPTLSLSIYYQSLGRILRPHENKKDAWFVDLCGNVNRFGHVDDLIVEQDLHGEWMVTSNGRRLTDVIM